MAMAISCTVYQSPQDDHILEGVSYYTVLLFLTDRKFICGVPSEEHSRQTTFVKDQSKDTRLLVEKKLQVTFGNHLTLLARPDFFFI